MSDSDQTGPASLGEALAARFGDRCQVTQALAETTLEVPVGDWLSVAQVLHDDPAFAFDQLTDLCGVDYATYGQAEWETESASETGFGRAAERPMDLAVEADRRFAVVVHLLSYRHNRRLRLRTFVPGEPPRIDSLMAVWRGADWFEREAFDLFGILFVGHPDLRRILTDYGFIGHPFRKDFPLSGQVEMRYDPEKGRVVYEPVSIEPRVLVPRVIRHDNRYLDPEAGTAEEDAADA